MAVNWMTVENIKCILCVFSQHNIRLLNNFTDFQEPSVSLTLCHSLTFSLIHMQKLHFVIQNLCFPSPESVLPSFHLSRARLPFSYLWTFNDSADIFYAYLMWQTLDVSFAELFDISKITLWTKRLKLTAKRLC